MKTKRLLTVVGPMLLGLSLASAAQAQYTVPWWTVDGGGAMFSTGGTYSLGGTIGQPDAGGPMTGGTYSLTGGFWVVGAAAPTTCPGDSDCDGVVGFSDIDYFVAAIPDNQAAWAALYAARHGGAPPPCPFLNNDCTGDGHVLFSDIDPFVALIPSACP